MVLRTEGELAGVPAATRKARPVHPRASAVRRAQAARNARGAAGRKDGQRAGLPSWRRLSRRSIEAAAVFLARTEWADWADSAELRVCCRRTGGCFASRQKTAAIWGLRCRRRATVCRRTFIGHPSAARRPSVARSSNYCPVAGLSSRHRFL